MQRAPLDTLITTQGKQSHESVARLNRADPHALRSRLPRPSLVVRRNSLFLLDCLVDRLLDRSTCAARPRRALRVHSATMSSLRSLIASVVDNDEGGFGPSSSHLPPQYKDIPYAPFSKNDKLGRIVDWNAEGSAGPAAATQQKGKYNREPKEAFGASAAGTFAYYHDEDEASFSVVSGAAGAKKPAGQSGGGLQRGGGRPGQMGRGGQFGARGPNGQFLRQGGPHQMGARGPMGMRNQQQQGGRGGYQGGRGGFQGGRGGWRDKEQRTREASIDVGSDWVSLEEIEFSRLSKLRLEVDIDEVETM